MVATSLEIVGVVLAALGGIALAVQAGVNSSLGRNVGKGLAGIISFGSGLLFLLIYFLISTYAAKAQGPTVSGFRGDVLVLHACQDQHKKSRPCQVSLLCRNTVVLIHWGLSWGLLCNYCHPFRSATRQRHPYWDSSHCTTCDSHILGWLWMGGLCQAPSAMASYCGRCADGHRCGAGVRLSWRTKAQQHVNDR